jgi:hypothetical protein
LSLGGSVRALRSRLSNAAPRIAVDRWLLERTIEHRGRAGGPSPPAEGPQAPGRQAASSPSRPRVHGRDQQGPSSCPLVIVPRQPADAPSVAPGTRAKEMDVPAEVDRRQAADRRRDRRAHPADGQGESPVGVHPDPGRARQARRQGLGDQDPHVAASERDGAGSPAGRSDVERVPQVAGPGDPGARLLHRGNGVASHDVCAVRDPPGLPRTRTLRGSLSTPATSRWGSGSRGSGS